MQYKIFFFFGTSLSKAAISLALTISVGGVMVDFVKELRGAAIEAHRRGPTSHKLFAEHLSGQK